MGEEEGKLNAASTYYGSVLVFDSHKFNADEYSFALSNMPSDLQLMTRWGGRRKIKCSFYILWICPSIQP